MIKITDELNNKIYNDELIKDVQFYETIETKFLEYEGSSIEYAVVGKEGDYLLLLPGTTGNFITYIEYLRKLSDKYRVIVVNYPNIDKIEKISELIIEILNYEKIESLYIFSHSLGGMISQFIVKKLNDRILGLVIAHSSTINNNLPKKIRKENRESITRFLRSVNGRFFKLFLRNFVKRIKKGIRLSGVENFEFWEEIYAKIIVNSSKEGLNSIYGSLEDFWKNYSFTEEDFSTFDSKVVIVEAETDLIYEMPEKEELKKIFKNVKYVELTGSSNMSIVRNKKRFLEIIKENF